MKIAKFVNLIACVVMAVAASGQNKTPLKLVQTIPLPGLKEGDFDHFAADVAGHRLFLTAEKNGAVQVFDTSTNKLTHTITGLDEPHALLLRTDLKKLFVVDGGASEVKIYDTDSDKLLGAVKLSEDADSIAYDPATKYMYVVNGGREAKTPHSLISVVDTSSSKKLRDIKIDCDHLEAILLEKSGPRMFINITGKNAVGVLDRNKSSLGSTWSLPEGDKQNVAMAFDEADHRLFTVTRTPPKLIVLNSDTGKLVASVASVALVDDMSYDAKQKRIYLAGDQFVDVIEQKDADHYAPLARVPGSFRAKTGLLVPELNRYYLAVPRHGDKDAEVRVFEVRP
jgi:DNA-binding beta-propeller fold protein YncE